MPSHCIEGGLKPAAAGVTALAAQTARATAEISVQTARGQGVTAGAVGAVGVIAGRIREVNGAAVEERAAATQEILRDVARAATGTGEVTRNVAGAAAASEEMGAAQALDAANGLSRPSEHLVRSGSLRRDRPGGLRLARTPTRTAGPGRARAAGSDERKGRPPERPSPAPVSLRNASRPKPFVPRQSKVAMTGTIIPPRSEEDGTASGARTDALTADLVAARIEALLKVLHRRRTELAAQIANLQSVQPSADTRLTVLTAELAGRMSSSVADLNLLIDQAEMFVRELAREAPTA